MIEDLKEKQIDCVNGAGIVGYVGGYLAARSVGANHEQAKKVGSALSKVEDALT